MNGEFAVGDIVELKKELDRFSEGYGNVPKGTRCRVVSLDGLVPLIELPEPYTGHCGENDRLVPSGRGWYVEPNEISKVTNSAAVGSRIPLPLELIEVFRQIVARRTGCTSSWDQHPGPVTQAEAEQIEHDLNELFDRAFAFVKKVVEPIDDRLAAR